MNAISAHRKIKVACDEVCAGIEERGRSASPGRVAIDAPCRDSLRRAGGSRAHYVR
jgi:hypothetical protein